MITERELFNLKKGTKLYLNFKNLTEFQKDHNTIVRLGTNIKYVYFDYVHKSRSKTCYGSKYDFGIVFRVPQEYSEHLWTQNHFFPVELFELGLSEKINKLLKY